MSDFELINYSPTIWTDGNPPYLEAEKLNNIEQGIAAAYANLNELTTQLLELKTGAVTKAALVNNALATTPGQAALDAVMGKTLMDKVETKIGYIRMLTKSDDLNNVMDNGIYWYLTDGAPANAPFSAASIVEVFGSGSDSTQKIQRVTRYGSVGQCAFRPLVGSAGWLDWTKVLTELDMADSGWRDLELTSAFKVYNNTSKAQYRKIGKMVEIRGVVTPVSNLEANATSIIGTLPSGYRPSYTIVQVCQGSYKNTWPLFAESSGALKIARYGTSENIEIPASAWLSMRMVYLID